MKNIGKTGQAKIKKGQIFHKSLSLRESLLNAPPSYTCTHTHMCTHMHTNLGNGVILYLVICNLLFFHLTKSHCFKLSSCTIIYPHPKGLLLLSLVAHSFSVCLFVYKMSHISQKNPNQWATRRTFPADQCSGNLCFDQRCLLREKPCIL